MKKIITAIGNQELNNILKKQKDIIIENPDIQYQEGIIEALEKYPETNFIILSENIIGNLKIEDLIQNIIIIKNNIKIILIYNEKIYTEDENLIKIIRYDEDYINIILKFFLDEREIKLKNKINNIENNLKKIKTQYEKKEIKNYNDKLSEENINKKIKMANKINKNNILKKIKEIIKKIKEKFRKKQKYIITIIGCSGVRKNNIYFYII